MKSVDPEMKAHVARCAEDEAVVNNALDPILGPTLAHWKVPKEDTPLAGRSWP